jgi:cytochrome c oxidase cbb3-type subunit 2
MASTARPASSSTTARSSGGSKRTGPDLARVGGRYSDEWHRIHLTNPRDVVPESNMPSYPWLAQATVDPADMAPKLNALRRLGVPYSDAEVAAAGDAVKGKTELEALIAYLQGMGVRSPQAKTAAAGAQGSAQ